MIEMFDKKDPQPLDTLINRVLCEMETCGPDSDEYPKLMAYLERLMKLKADEKPSRVSRDTMAIVMGNLCGILLIVAYEQKHVMTSKAFGAFIKTK